MSVDGPLVVFLEIVLINLLLSGDNAVVIAMAAGRLPDHLRARAVWWGIAGAIVLRIALALAAVRLLALPLLQAAGAVLLAVIAVRLVTDDGTHKVKSADSLKGAVQTIIMADFVMSLDNVLAVAALADGNMVLMAVGIALSIPLIPWGSTIMMRLLDRFPPLMYAGAAILGYAAGEMLVADRMAGPWLIALWRKLGVMAPFLAATLVLACGLLMRLRSRTGEAADGGKNDGSR
jgi:YjbE family integral membrane protein